MDTYLIVLFFVTLILTISGLYLLRLGFEKQRRIRYALAARIQLTLVLLISRHGIDVVREANVDGDVNDLLLLDRLTVSDIRSVVGGDYKRLMHLSDAVIYLDRFLSSQ